MPERSAWIRAGILLGVGLPALGLVAWLLARPGLAWMNWTAPTAWGLAGLAALLLVLAAVDILWPSYERKGLLPMPTTRGDRVFLDIVLLVGATFLWLILAPGASWLWVALPVILLGAVNLRWG